MAKSHSKAARDNRANQLNPTHPAYHRSRGGSPEDAARSAGTSKPVLDNRSNQLNPNNAAHQAARGNRSTSGSSPSSRRSSDNKPE